MTDGTAQFEEDLAPELSQEILVIGVGGAGGNMVRALAGKQLSGVDLLSVNTDMKALEQCRDVLPVLQIGSKAAQGLGSGGDPEIGRSAAEEDNDVIRQLVSGKKLVVVALGLGGGTGQGAGAEIAALAREQGVLTMAFASQPFKFEGEKRSRLAGQGLARLLENCDVVIRLPNDQLADIAESEANLLELFSRADDLVAVGVRSLCGMMVSHGVINIDFADIRRCVEDSNGLCSFGFGHGAGETRGQAAVRQALQHPFLGGSEAVQKAESFMVHILGGNSITLTEIEQVLGEIKKSARTDVEILVGTSVDSAMHDELAVTILLPNRSGKQLELPVFGESPVEPAVSSELLDKQKGRKRRKNRQSKLRIDPDDPGRFKNAMPTIINGEDLDIPTFLRRDIKLSFHH